jgi:UDP-glucuronate decarboxylase
MRSIVTGAAGFVGSHLCERLLRDGHHVVAIDDFSTGSRENVAHLAPDSKFELREHDILEPYSFEADRIYNLACPASPKQYQRDPIRTLLVSVKGTLHGLELAAKQKARFLQASTSEVYGDPEIHPQREDYVGHVNPIGPRACYDEGKRAAETLCFDFARTRGLEVRVARIFNTYGPRMAPDDGRVVSNFIVQALRGEPLTIYGNGTQTRSFCYVEDLVNGLELLMSHPTETGPVNLGNPIEKTMSELANAVLAATGGETSIVYEPLPADDPRKRRPDIAKAREKLAFEPRVPLERGLACTVEYFRSRLASGLNAGAPGAPKPS